MYTLSKKIIVSILLIITTLFTLVACTTSTGMRPEFKEAMDSYEEFYDEYCEFMIEYKEAGNPYDMLDDYLDILNRANEISAKFNKIGNEEMNDVEAAYYAKVTSRVAKKVLDATR
ncbi:MAG: hypothetical protein IKV61_01145 [Clostridia bacterium]|nr:hypothetical protein [Clostridia bacterium]